MDQYITIDVPELADLEEETEELEEMLELEALPRALVGSYLIG